LVSVPPQVLEPQDRRIRERELPSFSASQDITAARQRST
jgi:hypothetical protein